MNWTLRSTSSYSAAQRSGQEECQPSFPCEYQGSLEMSQGPHHEEEESWVEECQGDTYRERRILSALKIQLRKSQNKATSQKAMLPWALF